jgi:rhamnose transport system ATP-binding protein
MTSTLPLLQLEGLTKTFGAVRALQGVSFDLLAGEVHALLGENGAGKSTLIKIITGAHPADSGTVTLRGHQLERLTPASAHALGIACIYQQPALFPDLSVAENIALGVESPSPFKRIHWAKRRVRALDLLHRVGANLDPDIEIRRLSMPEQQLVEIARALGAGAQVLIMDEPTASLTAQEVDLLLAVTRDLRTHGVGIIYISHRLDEIFQVADRVTVLRDGESVGTHSVTGITKDRLIHLMVGRELSSERVTHREPSRDFVLELDQIGSVTGGVRDVSFQVGAGEIFGLAGLVGAGRTELARVLFGLTPADTGTIRLRRKAVRVQSPRDALGHGIGYVPEDRRRHGVILEMTVAENTTMAVHSTLFPGSWLRPERERKLTNELIGTLQIRSAGPETPTGNLSGGNQQKVALGRWLATHPQILILDEPTQGVDVAAKHEFHRMIRRLAADGIAVLLISSDLPEVLDLSHRIGVMRGGRLVAILDGPTADAQHVMTLALGQAPTSKERPAMELNRLDHHPGSQGGEGGAA